MAVALLPSWLTICSRLVPSVAAWWRWDQSSGVPLLVSNVVKRPAESLPIRRTEQFLEHFTNRRSNVNISSVDWSIKIPVAVTSRVWDVSQWEPCRGLRLVRPVRPAGQYLGALLAVSVTPRQPLTALRLVCCRPNKELTASILRLLNGNIQLHEFIHWNSDKQNMIKSIAICII